MDTISRISRMFNVSTRTLRYYEEIGLITSSRIEDYAYRVYSQEEIDKLQFILVLRKMNIGLSDIKKVLLSSDAYSLLHLMKKKLLDVENQLISLAELEQILKKIIVNIESNQIEHREFQLDSLNLIDEELMSHVMESTQLVGQKLKEKQTMKNDERKAVKQELDDVRIIHIPNFTVAASHCPDGENPEDIASERLADFIASKKLWDVKADFRVFGFNNPNPDETGEHGYEFYVTIPEDMEVEAPMLKKTFHGGLYAAYGIKMGDFHKWQYFGEWLKACEDYAYDRREPLGMEGSLEEHLNAFNYYKNKEKAFEYLDLLIPVKRINR